jgi:hypothetical protein
MLQAQRLNCWALKADWTSLNIFVNHAAPSMGDWGTNFVSGTNGWGFPKPECLYGTWQGPLGNTRQWHCLDEQGAAHPNTLLYAMGTL